MLKQTVTYEDYNGAQQTDTLYFNLTRTELSDMLDLQPRLEAFGNSTAGEGRGLTTEEIKEMLSVIKLLIERSYGERSEDGKRFAKSQEIFDAFKQTAVYDAFVFGMFENPEKAVEFMMGIIPKGLSPVDVNLPEVQTGGTISTVKEEVPAWVRENRAPSQEELRNATPDQLRLAFQLKSEKNLTQA